MQLEIIKEDIPDYNVPLAYIYYTRYLSENM